MTALALLAAVVGLVLVAGCGWFLFAAFVGGG